MDDGEKREQTHGPGLSSLPQRSLPGAPVTMTDDADNATRTDLVPLLELADKDCKWPIGTPGKPGFGFCGRPRQQKSPYCDGHTRIAWDGRHKR